MRARWLAAAALALGACTDEGLNPIVGAAISEVNPFGREAAPAAAGRVVTRADLTASGAVVIRARLVEDERPSLLFAAAENGGYVTYASQLRQTLTLRGSAVTATRGLGTDLLSASSSSPDPVITPIPPASWPARVTRRFEFPADAAQGRIERYECRFEFGPVREFVILEVRHRGVEVSEVCAGAAGSFENLHFADVSSGFVWRSLQWTGPEQGLVDIEVIEPYTGG